MLKSDLRTAYKHDPCVGLTCIGYNPVGTLLFAVISNVSCVSRRLPAIKCVFF